MTKSELQIMIDEMVQTAIIQEGILQKIKNKFVNKSEIGKAHYEAHTGGYRATVISGKARTSKKVAIESALCEFGCIENNKLVIFKKNLPQLKKTKLYLDRYEVVGKSNSDWKVKFIETVVVYNNCEEAIKDNNIEYEIRDTSAIINQRKKIYNECIRISKAALNAAKAKGHSIQGWKVPNPEDDYLYEGFINGLEHDITILQCDVWEFCNNKARDGIEMDRYQKCYVFLLEFIDNKIKESSLLDGHLDD